LAAARVKVTSVQQITERLEDLLGLLTGGSGTALRRHQTLAGLIDWSYDLLSDYELRLFGRLAVFAGGWTLEAAEAVGCLQAGAAAPRSATGARDSEVQNLLAQLVEKSLVAVERQPAQETRCRYLETIR
jgi:predicted ATPase